MSDAAGAVEVDAGDARHPGEIPFQIGKFAGVVAVPERHFQNAHAVSVVSLVVVCHRFPL
ncbi:hypothetical protein DAERI_020264 [Deinococcus aerius]|uniref:Uncharacterized protein n=1 Tax=Deinococcus aerius TaxID=200253 RepID=A0A2I9DQW2_9DEIO|nr:hypothetical protein DAERI_020264 [Deinococcus aerius]